MSWFALIRIGFVLLSAGLAWSQALPTLSVTPASATFTFQIGSTQLPAAQTLQIKRSGSGTALDFTVSVTPAAPWLIVTPTTGKTGTSISVRVNPTSLIAGTYATNIQVDAAGSAGSVTASVVFIVKNPPPTMAASPASLSYAWQTDAASAPAAQTMSVSTNGEPLTFTAAVAGGAWLTVAPTVGVIVLGSPVTLTSTVDTTGMLPGTYTAKVTLTSLTAANKTVTISVSLTVSPGTAVVSSIWPSMAPIGSNDALITIRGSHLFKASAVKAGTNDLTSIWVSTNVLLATIPKTLLTTQGSLAITVLNSPQPASNATSFTVTPPGPTIQAITSAASFSSGTGTVPAISPGEIISVFGAGLGPGNVIIATPAGNAYPTSLGSPAASVEFELTPNVWTPAPIIFAQANQISCQAPFAMVPSTGLKLRVIYNSLASTPFTYDGVVAEPGIFTVDSSGRGQAAALNFTASPLSYSLNSASNPATRGGVLILYLTGGGVINPLPNPEGQLTPNSPVPPLVSTASVTIGGEAAPVISATAVPGALGGLVQLNVTVPTSVRAGKDLPVMVTIGGRPSPLTATVSVK